MLKNCMNILGTIVKNNELFATGHPSILCFIRKIKDVSIAEEQKLKEIRMDKMVSKALEEVNIPVIPKSFHAFVLSNERLKNIFTLCILMNKFMSESVTYHFIREDFNRMYKSVIGASARI